MSPASPPPKKRMRSPVVVRAAPAEKLMLVLRDGRKIIGIMRSFDQFSNIVLEHAEERVVVGKRFADVPLGLYVIRGENLVLLGQIVRACDVSYACPAPPPHAPSRARGAGRRQGGGDSQHAAREVRGSRPHPLRPSPAPPPPTMGRDCWLTRLRVPLAHQSNGR